MPERAEPGRLDLYMSQYCELLPDNAEPGRVDPGVRDRDASVLWFGSGAESECSESEFERVVSCVSPSSGRVYPSDTLSLCYVYDMCVCDVCVCVCIQVIRCIYPSFWLKPCTHTFLHTHKATKSRCILIFSSGE